MDDFYVSKIQDYRKILENGYKKLKLNISKTEEKDKWDKLLEERCQMFAEHFSDDKRIHFLQTPENIILQDIKNILLSENSITFFDCEINCQDLIKQLLLKLVSPDLVEKLKAEKTENLTFFIREHHEEFFDNENLLLIESAHYVSEKEMKDLIDVLYYGLKEEVKIIIHYTYTTKSILTIKRKLAHIEHSPFLCKNCLQILYLSFEEAMCIFDESQCKLFGGYVCKDDMTYGKKGNIESVENIYVSSAIKDGKMSLDIPNQELVKILSKVSFNLLSSGYTVAYKSDDKNLFTEEELILVNGSKIDTLVDLEILAIKLLISHEIVICLNNIVCPENIKNKEPAKFLMAPNIAAKECIRSIIDKTS